MPPHETPTAEPPPPDVVPDPAPEVALDAVPEVVPEVALDAVPDVVPDGLPGAPPDGGFDFDLFGPIHSSVPGRLAPVARPHRSFPELPDPPEPPAVNPVLAAFISSILPGAGQIYVGQTTKGVVILCLAVFTCMGGGLLNVAAAVDALFIAQRKANGETVGDWKCF